MNNPTEFRIRNWEKYQHYRDRCPPWIKLHWEVLASRDWVMLADASRVLMVACMLVGSRNEGVIPNDPDYIKRVAYLNQKPNFKPLIEAGFLIPQDDASGCKQMLADDTTETEQSRVETEADNNIFPSDSKNKPEDARKPKPSKYEIPEYPEPLRKIEEFDATFREYLKARKSKATTRAQELVLQKLAQRPNQAIEGLNKAIERSWSGFEWGWIDNANSKSGMAPGQIHTENTELPL